MKHPVALWCVATALASLNCSLPANAADDYPVTADSKPRDDVPKGELLTFEFADSKLYPGTTREVTVYVPRQYTPDKPACVYVNQDGIQWEAPTVFDNLIARGELPVIVGVFVKPGVAKAADPARAQDRFNRSYEYDSMSDVYARFLLEELLPRVETMSARDGRPIKLSHRGVDRAIGGSSSGAICAFTAAWERPDAFTRVFSAIGTYVGLRGGNEYLTLIRKYEPKPIRVFLQDGSNDNNIYAGDWWMANQAMERALTFAGYEVNHVWGDGAHNGKQGTAIFPDAMRWLWKDWPQPVSAGVSKNAMLAALLIPGEEWSLASEGHRFTEGPTTNAKGEVFFNDVPASKTYRVGLDGKVSLWLEQSHGGSGAAFGPDGRLFHVAGESKQIVAYAPDRAATTIAQEIAGNDLAVTHTGNIYVTEPPAWDRIAPSKVWLIRPNGEKVVVDSGIRYANGVTLSPDQSLLYVDDYRSHWIYSFQILPDGTLANKQRYFWLHQLDTADQSGADGLRVDREGRVFVATGMGVQICDQPGRVNVILPTPNGQASNLTFGGEKFDTLYVTCGDKVYKRRLNTVGANAWDAPVKPPTPKL